MFLRISSLLTGSYREGRFEFTAATDLLSERSKDESLQHELRVLMGFDEDGSVDLPQALEGGRGGAEHQIHRPRLSTNPTAHSTTVSYPPPELRSTYMHYNRYAKRSFRYIGTGKACTYQEAA